MFDKRLLVTGISLLMVTSVAVAAALLAEGDHAVPVADVPVRDTASPRALVVFIIVSLLRAK